MEGKSTILYGMEIPFALRHSASGLQASCLLVAIALLHGYWALGGRWPGRDADSLARTVVGGPPGMAMPGPLATWALTLLLLLAAVMVAAGAHLLTLPLPASLVRMACRSGGGLLLLRGLVGFFDTRLRPGTQGSPFARLNIQLYSPLCLVLGLLVWRAVP